jgi:hypothetical protein
MCKIGTVVRSFLVERLIDLLGTEISHVRKWIDNCSGSAMKTTVGAASYPWFTLDFVHSFFR